MAATTLERRLDITDLSAKAATQSLPNFFSKFSLLEESQKSQTFHAEDYTEKMFRRSEKKIKAVFAMQFQATQVPQLKAKSLMISLVPVGVGKATVRLPKAPIVEGVCTWESPVYETVKLIKEVKTGRIREKFYYIVVATGSSKSGFLGEVSIDFADLAEGTKPRKLTLPLQTSKSGAILHVTVQKMQGDTDSRHDEDNDTNMIESPDDLSEVTSPHDGQNGSLEDEDSDCNGAESRDETSETSNDKFGRMSYQMKVLERKAELSELEVESLRKQIMKETKRGQQLSEQISCLTKERDVLKVECEQLKVSPKCQDEEGNASHTPKETHSMRSSLEDIKQALQREKQLNKKLKLHFQKTEDSNSEYVLAIRDLNKKLEHKNAEISRLSSKIKALHNAPESPRTMMDESETSKDVANKRGNADEVEMLKQKIEELYSEIEVHKKEKAEIQMELQSLTMDYQSLETENKDIYTKIEQKEQEKMEIQQDYAESLATVKQYKLRVAGLEEEIKRQARQQSESLNMIDELESQVEKLHDELENQLQVFEEDLGMVAEAKTEQERRAIKAEEALRKTRLSNANAAERLQEEFKQLSADMSLKIDENERIAHEALTEANDLRHKNDVLEELLQKAKDELQMTREKYEKLLQKVPEQNKESDESEKMGISKRWIKEKEDLERQIVSVRKEAEKLMQENVSMKSQIDQKKTKEENLHLEVKKLRVKNNEVKNQLNELELEKGNMKTEMSKLQADLHKKQQESIRGKDMKPMVPEGRKNKSKNNQCVEQKSDHCGGSSDVSSLLSEVASLKERNKSMEDELKEMHERYSEISLRFAEVEGERQQLVMALRNLKKN